MNENKAITKTATDVASLNPTLEGMSGLMVNYIAISKENPLTFRFSDRQGQPGQFVAHILGGRPRYSAKGPTGDWRNFANNEDLQTFVAENPDWQEVRKYVLLLRLPSVPETYVFSLPFASAIAFWTYADGLAKQGVATTGMWTRFSIERPARRSDASQVYSRVHFDADRPLSDEEKAAALPVAHGKTYAEDEGSEGEFEESPFPPTSPAEPEAESEEILIRRENMQAYERLTALPFGKNKTTHKPQAMPREQWDNQIVAGFNSRYGDPIFSFADLCPEDQAEALDKMKTQALDKGLLLQEQAVEWGLMAA